MRLRVAAGVAFVLLGLSAGAVESQAPVEGEVRQLVTFSFLPGRSADAISAYADQAIPLYEKDEAMLSFRAFREVESPVPLDLIVVSSFAGMAGMDASNAALRRLAAEAGTSIGAVYGGIGALSSGHTDQFVEMLPHLGVGDPASKRLTAFVWYRLAPNRADPEQAFEDAIEGAVVGYEAERDVPSATGRFLVSDGWHYLRFLGFDSLGEYQSYWAGLDEVGEYERIVGQTSERRTVIVASVPELSVR